MKHNRNIIIAVFTAIIMAVSLMPVMAIETSAAGMWTKVDLSNLKYSMNGTDRWSIVAENGEMILAQTSPDKTKANNCPAVSNVALEKGKAYTVEVQGRFAEAYTGAATESRGFGLIFGSYNDNPWGSDGRHYCAMLDRGEVNSRHIRVFSKYYALSTSNTMFAAADSATLASTDWQKIRVTITETGYMTLYLNGAVIGTSDQTGLWEGGYLGVIAYSVVSKVELKNLCFIEGVTTEDAVFENTASTAHLIRVSYQYADGSKAADDVADSLQEGQYYSYTTPQIDGFVPDKATVFGQVGKEDVDIVVKYSKSYKLTIHYVKKDGSKAMEDHIEENLISGYAYSVASIPISNYTIDKETVAGTVSDGDVEITVTYIPRVYHLTVKYVFEDGSEAHENYTADVKYGESYSVDSPEVAGYIADKDKVSATTIRKDTEVTVTYSAFEQSTAEATTTVAADNTSAGEPKGCGGFNAGFAILLPILMGSVAVFVYRKKN